MMSRSGPRSAFLVSTLAGECSEKLAAAASNSGLPGDGTTHSFHSSADSSSVRAFPKLYRNSSAVSMTARCRFAGFLKTGSVARSDESGSGSTPLICAASIAMAATARS